jgi:putative transposase
MLLTFKVKHGADLSTALKAGRQVALFAVKTGSKSSADVKQFGLPSTISNQVLRKYGRGAKQVSRIVLPVPGQSLSYTQGSVHIPCLKLTFPLNPHHAILRVNQVELNDTFACVSCEVEEAPITSQGWIGVDLNTTGHACVMANPETGKVNKLCKRARHIRWKARCQRRQLQHKGKLRRLKAHRRKEHRRLRDLDHKISAFVVSTAKAANKGIRVENLTGIRKRAKTAKSFKGTLHSWSFYQLASFIEYKAKLQGVRFEKIDPSFTSQADSRTGLLGTRLGKIFRSPSGRVEHADANAAFNIAQASLNVAQLRAERDARKGSLKPLKALCPMARTTPEPHPL